MRCAEANGRVAGNVNAFDDLRTLFGHDLSTGRWKGGVDDVVACAPGVHGLPEGNMGVSFVCSLMERKRTRKVCRSR